MQVYIRRVLSLYENGGIVMALPKNYSIWLAVDYNGIEKAFWNKPKRCEKHREWWVIKWFFQKAVLRSSLEEN